MHSDLNKIEYWIGGDLNMKKIILISILILLAIFIFSQEFTFLCWLLYFHPPKRYLLFVVNLFI